MVNLLFISNSSITYNIQFLLQPLLKVKVDIVADFDFGLKDVFEKRPSIVFMQDQIAGVTGESVARHIQMLLGSGAPSFIFIHDGSTKAKPIKGLFEYLIDLSRPEAIVLEEIKATLKSLLGTQWDKIYIPPIQYTPVIVEPEIPTGLDSGSTDILVRDLFADLDGSTDPTLKIDNDEVTIYSPSEPFEIVSSPHEQLAQMLSESATNDHAEQNVILKHEVSQQNDLNKSKVSIDTNPNNIASSEINTKKPKLASPTESKLVNQVLGTETLHATSNNSQNGTVYSATTELTTSQNESPADFVIVGTKPSEKVTPEELLRVFEGDIQTKASSKLFYVLFALLLISILAGIWLFFSRADHKTNSQSVHQVNVSTISKSPHYDSVVMKQLSSINNNDSPIHLPSFIPQSGLDASYSKSNPGWQRFINSEVDYRIFKISEKIMAIQVLAIKNGAISDTKMKAVLQEFIGDSEYHVTSRVNKNGIDIDRAIIASNNDLIIYRNKKEIRAFVISRK